MSSTLLKNPSVEILLKVVAVLALLIYYGAIFYLGVHPLDQGNKPEELHSFMRACVTTLGTTLATFTGMILGIKVGAIRSSRAGALSGEQTGRAAEGELSGWQLTAFILYVTSMGIACYFWVKDGERCDPILKHTTESVLGLVGGALTIVLGGKK